MKQFGVASFAVHLAGVESCEEYFAPILADRTTELLLVALVDEQGKLCRLLSFSGNTDGVVVQRTKIIAEALRRDAAGLIFAHNHPSGDASPSPNDLTFTKGMARAASACGLIVLDHLIFGGEVIFSFRRSGLL